MLLHAVVVVSDRDYGLERVCVLLGEDLLRVHMKTQIPIIATRCINICPTRLKHDHYDGPALSLHAGAPRPPGARCPGPALSPPRPGLRTGARHITAPRGLTRPHQAESVREPHRAERARLPQSGLTSPTTMLWSPLSLSRHLAIMSSLARTRPKPSTRTSL